MTPKIRCKNCHRWVPANPRIKNQKYCNRKPCQRVRKTEWERNKIATDPDYRTNRKESRDRWLENTPGYWSEYRRTHSGYRRQNRKMQKIRDAKRKARRLANMDASKIGKKMIPGSYYLIPISEDLANMDALMQKIFIIPEGYRDIKKSCKKGLNRLPEIDRIEFHPNSKEEIL